MEDELTSYIPIARSPLPIHIEGIHANNLKALVRLFEGYGPVRDWIVSDLSLGAWYGHWVATEFGQQLQIPTTQIHTQKPIRVDALAYADEAGLLVDAETIGNKVIQNALEIATQIINSIRDERHHIFLVLMPRFGFAWEQENLIFLRFLAQGLQMTTSRLVFVSTGPDTVAPPDDWIIHWQNVPEKDNPESSTNGLLSLVPGVIHHKIRQALKIDSRSMDENTLRLNGSWLVAPECRSAPEKVLNSEYSQLNLLTGNYQWLQTYAQYYSDDCAPDSKLFITQAWHRLEEGAGDIALRLINRAAIGKRSIWERSAIEGIALAMCIALKHFEMAVRFPDPLPLMPTKMRAYHLQNKGWGFIMVGRPVEAEQYFQQARELLSQHTSSREYLYLLNISALNKLRLGDVESALVLEQKIGEHLLHLPRKDWHLEYLNALNTARLYSRMEEPEQAKHYFERAFATAYGLRSNSDLIFINTTLARLWTRLGNMEQAFSAWLRAGLHWAASDVPESLSERVARSIISQTPFLDRLVEDVSLALTAQIKEAAAAIGIRDLDSIELDSTSIDWHVFIYSSEKEIGPLDYAIGGNGWSYITTSLPAKPRYRGLNYTRLCQLLYHILSLLSSIPLQKNVKTILIDHRFGRELATTADELLETSLRLGIPEVVFEGRSIALGPADHAKLRDTLKVRLGLAIDNITIENSETKVEFKRYLPPKTVSPLEDRILQAIDDHPSLSRLYERLQTFPRKDIYHAVHSLEQSRIVETHMPPGTFEGSIFSACSEAANSEKHKTNRA